MHDCAKDILAYHDNEVTLPQSERTAMRDRRNANRDRLKNRLDDGGKPKPEYFIKQGSYAMLTMVQDPENDYDIDDGAYFIQAALKNVDGSDMKPATLREMVRDALKDDRFKRQPEVRDACVRVYYDEGYHVDIPVYRIRSGDGDYELASGDRWLLSRAADVEDWFDKTNEALSPDKVNGRQFRRIVRDVKKFARSRKAWRQSIASGFVVTKLVAECYVSDSEREDTALRDTIRRLHDRLLASLQVSHPVTPGAMLTVGSSDTRTAYFRDRLKAAIDELTVLDKYDCTRKVALSAWDKVFNTEFFSTRFASTAAEVSAASSLLRPPASAPGLNFPNRPVKPNKPAGFASCFGR